MHITVRAVHNACHPPANQPALCALIHLAVLLRHHFGYTCTAALQTTLFQQEGGQQFTDVVFFCFLCLLPVAATASLWPTPSAPEVAHGSATFAASY
jgi:hypothetical protein